MSLQSFITTHRAELIEACRLKAAQRREEAWVPAHALGVARFLDQLVEVLSRAPVATGDDQAPAAVGTTAKNEISRTAARHGAFMLSHAYTIDQVVHEYGDVCQAITGMAIARDASLTTDEFRILNSCLDDAIAEAVTAHGAQAAQQGVQRERHLASRLEILADDCQRVATIAVQAHAAIMTGKVGMSGATGALLGHSLNELLYLAEQARLPADDVRLRDGEG
jgi:hypothetical protein